MISTKDQTLKTPDQEQVLVQGSGGVIHAKEKDPEG